MTVTPSSINLQSCHDVPSNWGSSGRQYLVLQELFLLHWTWLVNLNSCFLFCPFRVPSTVPQAEHWMKASLNGSNPQEEQEVVPLPIRKWWLLYPSPLWPGSSWLLCKRSSILQQASLPSKTEARESTIRLAHYYLLLPFPVIFMTQSSTLLSCEGSIFEDVFPCLK